jgi:hypothetical protein
MSDANKLMVIGIKGVMGAVQALNISKDTSQIMNFLQRTNTRVTRPDRIQFGQQPDPIDSTRTIDCPEERAAIARILELDSAGMSLRKIGAQLLREGISNRGGNWSASIVSTILKREKEKV